MPAPDDRSLLPLMTGAQGGGGRRLRFPLAGAAPRGERGLLRPLAGAVPRGERGLLRPLVGVAALTCMAGCRLDLTHFA
jgi:hypothetical protein